MSAVSPKLIDSIYQQASLWLGLPDKNDLSAATPIYIDLVTAFEETAKEIGMRPAIYIKDGARWLAYGKARCIAKFCDKGSTCSFAMTEKEQKMHPFSVRDTIKENQTPDTQIVLKFLDQFTNWVNHTFTKIWLAEQRVNVPFTKSNPPQQQVLPRPTTGIKPASCPAVIGRKEEEEKEAADEEKEMMNAPPWTKVINDVKHFVLCGVTYETESEMTDYKAFEPELGFESRVIGMTRAILGFLNKGSGSLLIGIREKKVGKDGRCWEVQGFHKMYLDKLERLILGLTSGFVPKNTAPKNFSFILHPICDAQGEVLQHMTLMEMKFERKPENYFHIFLAGDSLAYYMRTPSETPRFSGAIMTIIQYYQKKIRAAATPEEKEEWLHARDQTIREIDDRMSELFPVV
jgi:hypothetical protein